MRNNKGSICAEYFRLDYDKKRKKNSSYIRVQVVFQKRRWRGLSDRQAF